MKSRPAQNHDPDKPRDDSSHKWNAQVDQDRDRRLTVLQFERSLVRDDVDEQETHGRVQDDLQNGVDDDDDGAVIVIAMRQLVPDHHHSDAPV